MKKEKMISETILESLDAVAYYAGIVFLVLFAVLVLLVIIRVIVKAFRGEKVEITPVGVANDLPDSVTGMNKYRDALDTDKGKDEE